MIRLPKIKRRKAAYLVGIWALVIVVPLILTAFQLHWYNLKELTAWFSKWDVPGKGHRIVVFAPHCDDEILGAGGLLGQAAKDGAEIWVVLVTNGDGFRYAASMDRHSIVVRPQGYVEFGYRRQKESRAALNRLGIPNAHIITLGYPDRGLEAMWAKNWNRPYRSPYTRDSSTPYSNSYTHNADYTGKQLLADIEKLLKQIDPTDLYIPHPNDQHGDHWATGAFVSEAIYDLGWSEKKHVGLYLAHRGDWPVPQGLHENRRLVPPAALADLDTNWHQCSLDEETIKDKKRAIQEFKTQTAVTNRFLMSFVRQNELFGTRSEQDDIEECSSIRVDGKLDDWEDMEPTILDPVDDGLPVHSQPSADLKCLYVAKDAHRYYFAISIRGSVGGGSSYDLMVRPLGTSAATNVVTLRRGKAAPRGWKAAFGKNAIEVSCPVDEWGGKPLMLAVRTRARWLSIDRSAFRVLKP